MKESNNSGMMFSLVEKWRQSGQSQRKFCLDNNIKLPTFSYWVRKYRQQKNPDNVFFPIQVSESSPGAARVELIFQNGLTLKIY